jgi:hypothetical protein
VTLTDEGRLNPLTDALPERRSPDSRRDDRHDPLARSAQAAAEAGQLLFKHFETCVLRRERNQDVVGGLVALQRPA